MGGMKSRRIHLYFFKVDVISVLVVVDVTGGESSTMIGKDVSVGLVSGLLSGMDCVKGCISSLE